MLRRSLPYIAFGLVAITATAVLYVRFRWQSGTREIRDQLEAQRLPVHPEVYDAGELEGLPAPVQRYFRAALTDGQRIITGVHIEQTGSFNMSETGEQWKPFAANQRVITRRPGFDWDASVSMMPGLSVRVHDAYVGGVGLLHAAVLGLVTVAHMRGTADVAEGELMRYLAEGAWYPTALLPSHGVEWDAVDDVSARATLKDGDVTVTLLFSFSSDGLVDSVRAESRGRIVNGSVVGTPWQGRFRNHAMRDGMRVPLDGEVTWLMPDGAHAYWRGHMTSFRYEFADS